MYSCVKKKRDILCPLYIEPPSSSHCDIKDDITEVQFPAQGYLMLTSESHLFSPDDLPTTQGHH